MAINDCEDQEPGRCLTQGFDHEDDDWDDYFVIRQLVTQLTDRLHAVEKKRVADKQRMHSLICSLQVEACARHELEEKNKDLLHRFEELEGLHAKKALGESGSCQDSAAIPPLLQSVADAVHKAVEVRASEWPPTSNPTGDLSADAVKDGGEVRASEVPPTSNLAGDSSPSAPPYVGMVSARTSSFQSSSIDAADCSGGSRSKRAGNPVLSIPPCEARQVAQRQRHIHTPRNRDPIRVADSSSALHLAENPDSCTHPNEAQQVFKESLLQGLERDRAKLQRIAWQTEREARAKHEIEEKNKELRCKIEQLEGRQPVRQSVSRQDFAAIPPLPQSTADAGGSPASNLAGDSSSSSPPYVGMESTHHGRDPSIGQAMERNLVMKSLQSMLHNLQIVKRSKFAVEQQHKELLQKIEELEGLPASPGELGFPCRHV